MLLPLEDLLSCRVLSCLLSFYITVLCIASVPRHTPSMECKLPCGIRDASDITKPVFGIHALCVCGFHQPQSQNLQRKLHLYGAKL